MTANEYSFLLEMISSKIDRGDGCITVNVLKTIEFYTLNGWIVWDLNYISIKLL